MGIGDAMRGARGNLEEKLLTGLNPEQTQVVLHDKGPLLAAAVAGAGKTAALVRRVSYLVGIRGVDPSRVLAVTFSKKAAEEMNERLESQLGETEARIGTFHSLSLEILRKENPQLLSDWKIDDRNSFRNAIKDATGYRGMDWKIADATVLEGYISFCKSNLARPNDKVAFEIAQNMYRMDPKPTKLPHKMVEAYRRAEDLRRERRLLTFDDMLIDAVEMLATNENVRMKWASRYDYVLQDEAQDQNLAQLKLGELLAKDHKNYMLVGDPAQTIYTWRGAQPSKLLGFEQDWGARVVKMGRNYRCGRKIIDAANRVLASMDPAQRLEMEMICERGTEGEVTVRMFDDLDAEAENIGEEILKLVQDGKKYKDIAILYRTNALSRAAEEAMLSHRIPYRVIGGANFYERKEVRSLLAYLRLADGRGEIEDIGRCINAPFRFLGKAFVERVTDAAQDAYRDAAKNKTRVDWITLVREVASQAGLQSRQRAAAVDWADLVDGIQRAIESAKSDEANDTTKQTAKPAFILEQIVMQTQYTQWLERDEGEESTENSRVSNVRELIRAATRFRSVKELLDYIDITMKSAKKQAKDAEADRVTLTTLHRSKGLEWGTVFLIGASEKILPHARAEDIEEERRLFYVGVTRARDQLYITSPQNLSSGNKVIIVNPSPFIYEAGLEIEDKTGGLGDEDREYNEGGERGDVRAADGRWEKMG